ncbi:DNA alkylation repair protein [Chitinophaga sp. 212800010-3]|uniref:DNA alkylation repair protein n=1 Tax=unclassified Chitinophaga TaxID=2619133 RepID=UPI002DE71C7B|nr:DNA-7-methylguanine glycosylase [Chitinophaga sp. 212800010-3]
MEYMQLLAEVFTTAVNENNAMAMKAYLRDQFEHIGIKTPERRNMLKTVIARHGLPTVSDMPMLVKMLWAMPEREYQYIAIDLMERFKKQWNPDDIHLFEYMITHKSWWDSVDSVVSALAGPWFKKFPAAQPAITDRWISSDNFWLQRSAIIFQNAYKKDTDEKLLYRYIQRCASSNEFFIRKAIGWALREYSKTNPESVRKFVMQTPLASLSQREALRRIV